MSRAVVRKLSALYRGTFLFGVCCGISLALTPLILNSASFDKEEIGSLALAFAAGLVLFSLPAGKVIERFGAKRTLTWALLGYAICVALFPLMEGYAAIATIRFLDGAFSIFVWIGSETVVLSRSDPREKAHRTSLYAIWLASGYVAGPLLARVASPFLSYVQLFWVAALLGVLAVIYLHRRLADDTPSPEDELGLDGCAGQGLSRGNLLWRIKTSCFAIFSYGYFQSAVVLFLPLYLMESKGVSEADTIVLPGLFCLGMLLFSNWAGRQADVFGHLPMMVVLCALGMSCVLGFVFVDQYWIMCTLVLCAGATLAAMSPIALALTGVVVPRAQLGQANALYNMFYASGILLGPPMSSLLFARLGGSMMLLHLAALWACFVVFCIVFCVDDPAVAGRFSRSRLNRDEALAEISD